MNYAEIKNCSIENGPGVRVSLFVSGCRSHCPGCQNECAWDFNYGKEWGSEAMRSLLSCLNNSYIRGLTILGGEPMEPENAPTVLAICELVKREYPDKDIWIYSGFQYEYLIKKYPQLEFYADMLVDGPWLEKEADLSLRFRGSRNQRIIDIPKSVSCGRAMKWTNPIEHDPECNMKGML